MFLLRFAPRLSTSTLVASALEASTGNAVPHDSSFCDLLWAALARELKRPDVDLVVLWEEYRGAEGRIRRHRGIAVMLRPNLCCASGFASVGAAGRGGLSDLTERVITVRDTTFFKTRLVPPMRRASRRPKSH